MTRPNWAMVVLTVFLAAGGRVAAQPPCVGDCNGNGAVAINELIVGVNIALGNFSVDQCPSFDSNWNGAVAVNELIQAVNAALGGCVAATPTPGTPTATPTETEPAATATPNEIVEEVAGAAASVANSLSAIVNVVGAVVAGATGGAGAGAASSGLPGRGAGGNPDPCELGGTVFSDIEVVFPVANITIEFNMCEVSRPGGSVVFNGSLIVSGLNLQFRGNGAFNATIEFKDDQGQTSAVTQADIQSPIVLAVTPGGVDPCAVDLPVVGSQLIAGVDMPMLTGTLDSIVPDEGSARVAFQNTAVELDILESDDDCIPT
ncbi:MAG TPA: hypothetical protein ENO14_02065, partial [Chromatiales bacterium]|nr:hypothetical protein [Chromatiales bacterium]